MIEAFERNLLGAVLLDNSTGEEWASNWEQISRLSADDFSLDSHRRIFTSLRNLASGSEPLSLLTLADELKSGKQLETVGGYAYLLSLCNGIVTVPSHVRHCAQRIREESGRRHIAHTLDAIAHHNDERSATVSEIRARLAELSLSAAEYEAGVGIRTFEDIPDIFAANISDPSYIVPDIAPQGALMLMAGEPGIGKSYLALRLAMSCALGTRFLGRDCVKTPALYLDRENPGAIMRERVRLMADGPVPGLKIWGGWLDDGVPELADPRLVAIAREQKPLIVVDSLIRFHDGDENSAADMSQVLATLRALSNAGATVLTIHHRGKGENAADYRGSSDIKGGPDLVYTLTRDECEGLLTLKAVKNRFGAERTFTVRADFVTGTFEATEAPAAAERRDKVAAIREAIANNPGLSQNKIVEQVKVNRAEVYRLLRQLNGQHWRSEPGPYNSTRYFSMTCSVVPEQVGTTGTTGTGEGLSCSVVPHPRVEQLEQPRTPQEQHNSEMTAECLGEIFAFLEPRGIEPVAFYSCPGGGM